MKNVIIVSFSPPNDGNCAKISNFLLEYHRQTNVRTYFVNANNFQACNGCDYECLSQGKECPALNADQRAIYDGIKDSDLVYMILPNFCGHPCANFYAFNERCVGYFNGDRALMAQYMNVRKRFIIVSNTEGATFDAAMRLQTSGEPDVMYLKSGKYRKRSTAGDLMDSNEAKADLEAFLAQVTLG